MVSQRTKAIPAGGHEVAAQQPITKQTFFFEQLLSISHRPCLSGVTLAPTATTSTVVAAATTEQIFGVRTYRSLTAHHGMEVAVEMDVHSRCGLGGW